MDNNEKKVQDKINEFIEKGTETFKSTSKTLTDQLVKERKKLEIRSQIGQHERQIHKAYERIGEAYCKHLETGESLDSLEDVIALVQSNKKVIELLNDQLSQLVDTKNEE